jgi:hypothetical protein
VLLFKTLSTPIETDREVRKEMLEEVFVLCGGRERIEFCVVWVGGCEKKVKIFWNGEFYQDHKLR